MLDFKKIPALAALLGSLALVAATASTAYAVRAPGNCVRDAQGNVHCSYTNVYRGDGGILRQTATCTSTKDGQVTTRNESGGLFFRQGTVINCSNHEPLP